ncbi:DUF1294 domain-containing protein [Flavobacterium omnivorum]|nr:DUF1294 domain-containing protein [Flavobacterium omnivorum]
MSFLFWYFPLINLVAFSIIEVDKQLAIQQKRRISERNLLFSSAIGGTIGSGLAMLIFRHKTSKISFLRKFFIIGILQVFLVYFYVIKSKKLLLLITSKVASGYAFAKAAGTFDFLVSLHLK